MSVPNMWRTKQQRYRLRGQVCPVCSTAQFPPRQTCLDCGAAINRDDVEPQAADEVEAEYPLLLSSRLALVPAGDD